MNVEDMVRKIEAVLLLMAAGGCAHAPPPCRCVCETPEPAISQGPGTVAPEVLVPEEGRTNIYDIMIPVYASTSITLDEGSFTPVYGSNTDWPAVDKAIDDAVKETDEELEE